ncbi:hypothetical protein Scep_021312 [Stephania cephalantha]|uniref:Uncharacterized protein n=1 Tax=Stephania cephalantha TaxID=152367 RepID=A0AAP0FAL5_9MAGN
MGHRRDRRKGDRERAATAAARRPELRRGWLTRRALELRRRREAMAPTRRSGSGRGGGAVNNVEQRRERERERSPVREREREREGSSDEELRLSKKTRGADGGSRRREARTTSERSRWRDDKQTTVSGSTGEPPFHRSATPIAVRRRPSKGSTQGDRERASSAALNSGADGLDRDAAPAARRREAMTHAREKRQRRRAPQRHGERRGATARWRVA